MAQAPILSSRSATVIVLLIIGLVSYYWFFSKPKLTSDIAQEEKHIQILQKASLGVLGMSDWNLIKKEAMGNVNGKLKITHGMIDIEGKEKAYRVEVVDTTVDIPKGVILLLHGMRFKSQTWFDLGTLHVFASYGYRVVAVDLPGYGQTEKMNMDPVAFMSELVKSLRVNEPGGVIIVSPSMSGSYSLPFLMASQVKFAGFVPVAPISTDRYKPEDYKKIQVPTLIIYGSTDTSLGTESLKNLRNLPNSQIEQIKDAGHACYLDQPLLFHKRVHEFAKVIFKSK